MQGDPTRGQASPEGEGPERQWANEERPSSWPDVPDADAARHRLARLARTIEADVIPRLVQAHRPGAANPQPGSVVPYPADIDTLLQQILRGSEAETLALIDGLRERGVSVESLYLDVFGPIARRLGEMWEDDSCDFSTVTVALGRLQRLLRELSPAFGTEIEHPANGRRALFVQPRDEQHSFGLSMVAEFFRRDGWDVIGGVTSGSTSSASRSAATAACPGCRKPSLPCARPRATPRWRCWSVARLSWPGRKWLWRWVPTARPATARKRRWWPSACSAMAGCEKNNG
jgi:hypothetical protein